MKLKKFLCSLIALCFAFAVIAFLPETVKVDAAGAPDVFKLAGYSYSIEYLLRDFGLDKKDGEDTYLGGRTVTYRLTHDFDANATIDENTTGYEQSTSATVASGGSVIFNRVNCRYTFTVSDDDGDSVFTVDSVDTVTSPDTIYDTALLSEYRTVIDNYAKDLNTSSTFKISEIEKKQSVSTVAKKELFDILDIKVVLNYYVPGSNTLSTTSGASVSSLSFKTTKTGVYSFYYTFSALDHTDSVDGLLTGEGGFYEDKDNDGSVSAGDELKIPVFTFTVTDVAKPEVSVGVSEKAYLNLEYKVDCFAITANNYTPQYELYFIPEGESAYYDRDGEAYDRANNGDQKYIDAVLSDPNVKNVTDSFDTDSMKFTPKDKGYYYVLLNLYNDAGYSDAVMSQAISAVDEYKVVETEKQFFKYNTTSIIFLSISALSFIGIIVVLFVKPKEKKALEVKSDNK